MRRYPQGKKLSSFRQIRCWPRDCHKFAPQRDDNCASASVILRALGLPHSSALSSFPCTRARTHTHVDALVYAWLAERRTAAAREVHRASARRRRLSRPPPFGPDGSPVSVVVRHLRRIGKGVKEPTCRSVYPSRQSRRFTERFESAREREREREIDIPERSRQSARIAFVDRCVDGEPRGLQGGRIGGAALGYSVRRKCKLSCATVEPEPAHAVTNAQLRGPNLKQSTRSIRPTTMNGPVYASSCPALQSNLSLHSSSYYSEYSGTARRRLSSTGEADTSATSSYEGSDSSENSDESRLDPVSQMEREQLETFFRGLKSQVFVCESLANLYLGSASQTERWELRFTGIPVVVLDLGETRSRSKRRIQILLAERGTCFTLWRETIDNLSSYKVSGPAFHTMCLSSDHTRLAGLSFDNSKAANDLWQHIERLVSCPENISLSVPGKKKKKPVQKKVVLPAKSNISQPCQFQHVTSVDAADRSRYFSLQTLVPALSELENSLEANF